MPQAAPTALQPMPLLRVLPAPHSLVEVGSSSAERRDADPVWRGRWLLPTAPQPAPIRQLHPVSCSASDHHVCFRSWHCLNPTQLFCLVDLGASPSFVSEDASVTPSRMEPSWVSCHQTKSAGSVRNQSHQPLVSSASEAIHRLSIFPPCLPVEPVIALQRRWRHCGHLDLPGPFVIEASPLDSAQSRRWRKLTSDTATGDS